MPRLSSSASVILCRAGASCPRCTPTPGLLRKKPLAERVGMDPGALTRQLKALQELGWVERNTSERDNRVTNVTLSALGHGIVEQAMPLRSGFLQDVLENVSETTMRNLSKGLEELEGGIAEAVLRTQQDKADAA
ncbi:transcriptional regulator [Cupriavidus basilensis OR16]|uniref:Transcriptional regulator n=1 Tax=Cupriavidus basilensis OR16 TaxID=1127483 RepID=H1SGT7_9BURK|nr:transcriptional regulator [Cupriavidus basilensis OR16]